MRKGEIRNNILAESPEEFSEQLVSWIDDIEANLKDILNTLDGIKGLDDLHKIEDARNALDKICDGLY